MCGPRSGRNPSSHECAGGKCRAIAGDRDGEAHCRGLTQQAQQHVDAAPCVVLVRGRGEALPAVDEQHDQWHCRPLGASVSDRTDAKFGEECMSSGDLAREPGEQALHAAEVVAGDDRAAVWKFGQRTEPAA